MPLLTQKLFGDPGHQQANINGLFHLLSLCGGTSFGSHRRRLPSPVWQSLVASLCRVQRLATKQNAKVTEGG